MLTVITYFPPREEAEVNPALALPLIGSLLLTGGAAGAFCTPPLSATLTWLQIVLLALMYVAIAACTHVSATWLIRRLFREHIELAAIPLMLATWMSVAWLPLLSLLHKEGSAWEIAVIPVIAMSVAFFATQWRVVPPDFANGPVREEKAVSGFQLLDAGHDAVRSLLPTFAVAICFQLGVMAVANRMLMMSGLLFGCCCVLPVWRLVEAPRSVRVSMRTIAGKTCPILLCIVLALVPFLSHSSLAQKLFGSLHFAGLEIPRMPKPVARGHAGGAQSAIVLALPKKPQLKIIPPPPVSKTIAANRISKPVVIPFDGVYWFMPYYETRPPANALVQRGDPLKAHVHTTNGTTLKMEARQRLADPLSLACCRAVTLDMTNADTRPGGIAIELWMKIAGRRKGGMRYFGSLPLLSSTVHPMPLRRAPVNESLTFRLPPQQAGETYDEIAVKIKPAPDRDLGGAHVAVRSFTLVPR